MARLFGRLFSALLLLGMLRRRKTESVLMDEYSIQLTVRAPLGEEMRTHDKKISDLEKQVEKQELRLEQQRAGLAETEKQEFASSSSGLRPMLRRRNCSFRLSRKS